MEATSFRNACSIKAHGLACQLTKTAALSQRIFQFQLQKIYIFSFDFNEFITEKNCHIDRSVEFSDRNLQ